MVKKPGVILTIYHFHVLKFTENMGLTRHSPVCLNSMEMGVLPFTLCLTFTANIFEILIYTFTSKSVSHSYISFALLLPESLKKHFHTDSEVVSALDSLGKISGSSLVIGTPFT